MKLTLKQNDSQLFKSNQAKSSYLIGRGSDCDIRILNEHLSRNHLKMWQEGTKAYIENISPSNWVIVNGEKLSNGSVLEVFDFFTIELPDNISVEFNIDEALENKSKIELNLDKHKKVKPTKKNKNFSKQAPKDNTSFLMKILIIVSLLAAIYFIIGDSI